MTAPSYFRVCSTCRTPIPYSGRYYKCSVSTCNKKVTALYFCSVPCWDAHVPDAKHRDAWAEEEFAPEGPTMNEEKPVRRKVVSPSAPPPAPLGRTDLPEDVLVVMSKIKGYIKAHSDLRTSDGVSDPLSAHLRQVCAAAIESARACGRGTVMDRDIVAVLRGERAED